MAGDTIITIIGNCVADPELRFLPSGVAMVAFTVASTPRTFDRQSNEWKDGATLFMRCVAWREAAENIAESLQRGSRVIVTGRLVDNTYEKDGVKQYGVQLQVDEVGPSLRYATAKVNRAQRGGSGAPQQQAPSGYGAPTGYGQQPPADPWAANQSAGRGGYGTPTDEPPF